MARYSGTIKNNSSDKANSPAKAKGTGLDLALPEEPNKRRACNIRISVTEPHVRISCERSQPNR